MNKHRAWAAIAVLTCLMQAAPAFADIDKAGERLVIRDHEVDTSEPSLEPWLLSPEWPQWPEATSVGVRRGDMDVHFGTNVAGPGLAAYRFNIVAGGSNDDRALGIVALPDGGSFVVGRAGVLVDGNRSGSRLGIMRLLPDGRADSGFGVSASGRQILELMPEPENRALDLTHAQGLVVDLEPLGGIIRFYLLGQYRFPTSSDNDVDFAVVCVAIASTGPNQGLFEACPNFGNNGLRLIDFDNGIGFRTDIPAALYLDTRGTTNNWRILVAGRALRNDGGSSNQDMAIARLDLFTGNLDATFNGDGRLVVGVDLIPHGNELADSLLVKPDGKILIGGTTATIGQSSTRAVLLQRLPNGAPDLAFCATSNSDCDSPPELRSGRRGWNDDPSGAMSTSRVSALVFEQTTADPAAIVVRTRGFVDGPRVGAVSRVFDSGGCGGILCSTAILDGFDHILPVAAVADRNGVVVATYGLVIGSEHSNTHIFRVHTQFGAVVDSQFTSIAPFPRQDWEVATQDGSTTRSAPSAIVLDAKGRYLVAGWHRNQLALDDNRYLIARMQNDVIFDHGFHYGGTP